MDDPAPAVRSTPSPRTPSLPRRIEFWGDPPPATVVVALTFAAVRDAYGRVLMARRVDTGNWELPGGAIEPGETVTEAAVREVAEETAVAIRITGLAGVFCDPAHVVVYPRTGEVRQQHVTLLHAVPAPGPVRHSRSGRPPVPHPDHEETDAVAWVDLDDLPCFPVHPSMHRRLDHAVRHRRSAGPVHVD